jgi:hypothetical protein
VTNAHPVGTYSVTLKAFSGNAEPANASFTLIVTSTGESCSDPIFAEPGNPEVSNEALDVAVGDFNRDGKQDLAIAKYNGNVSIVFGDGMGHFTDLRSFTVNSEAASVAVGDLNGDGKEDLVVANRSSGRVSICLGDGMGNFGYVPIFLGVNTNPSCVKIGDFNGDGKPDLAVSKIAFGNNVLILLGDGTGQFAFGPTFHAGTSVVSLVVGDFNRDGKQDLATSNSSSDDVSIFLGNGMGGFGPATNLAVGDGPRTIVIGDFNGDGKQDLATANYNSNDVSVLLGDGMGSFAAALNFPAADMPHGLAVGDFNNDNKEDLAVTQYDLAHADKVLLLLGDGTGHFSTVSELGVGDFPQAIATGDFNGDAKQDIVVTSRGGAQTVSIFLQNCDDCILCHKNATITVPCNSTEYQRHRDHGDVIGACTTEFDGGR